MLYTEEAFKKLDEAHALTDLLQPIGSALYTVLDEARADLRARYPADLFWDHQNRQNLSRMVNQRATRIWSDFGSEDWLIFDHTGFLHICENQTGLRMILRKVDPITHHVPRANATEANRVYFSQSHCLGEGELTSLEQSTLFDEGKLKPDLRRIQLVCAWDEVADDSIDVTVYKPSEPGRYGHENHYFFKYQLSDRGMEQDRELQYRTYESDDVNLLPQLLQDHTDADESLTDADTETEEIDNASEHRHGDSSD